MTIMLTLFNLPVIQVSLGAFLREFRPWAYGLSLCAYAGLVIIKGYFDWKSNNTSSKSRIRTPADAVEIIALNILLLAAGILYLAGDNIRMIYKDFEFEVPIGSDNLKVPVRDLRSYLVATSLALLILNQIMPPVLKHIRKYRQPSTVMTLKVVEHKTTDSEANDFWKHSDITLSTPEGYFADWKKKVLIHLTYNEPEDSETQEGGQEHKIQLHNKECHSSDCRREIVTILFKGVLKKFEDILDIMVQFRPDIDPNEAIKGTMPKFSINPCSGATSELPTNNECTWIATFDVTKVQIDDYTEALGSNGTYQTVSQNITVTDSQPQTNKIASFHLIQTYTKLLNYALLVDALYTTILNEITGTNAMTLDGNVCPTGHRWIAHCIFIFASISWFIATLAVLPFGYCYGTKYERLGTVQDIIQYLQLDLFQNVLWTATSRISMYVIIKLFKVWENKRDIIISLVVVFCTPALIAVGIFMILLTLPIILLPIGLIVFGIFMLLTLLSILLEIQLLIITVAVSILVAITLIVLLFIMGLVLNVCKLLLSLTLLILYAGTVGILIILPLITLPIIMGMALLYYYPYAISVDFGALLLLLFFAIYGFILLLLRSRKCKRVMTYLGYSNIITGDDSINFPALNEKWNNYWQCQKSIRHQAETFFTKICGLLMSINFWLTFTWGFLTALYLPLYLIADNSWPWVCYVGGQRNWSFIRIPLLLLTYAINLIPMIYQGIQIVFNFLKQNEKEHSSKRSLIWIYNLEYGIA